MIGNVSLNMKKAPKSGEHPLSLKNMVATDFFVQKVTFSLCHFQRGPTLRRGHRVELRVTSRSKRAENKWKGLRKIGYQQDLAILNPHRERFPEGRGVPCPQGLPQQFFLRSEGVCTPQETQLFCFPQLLHSTTDWPKGCLFTMSGHIPPQEFAGQGF